MESSINRSEWTNFWKKFSSSCEKNGTNWLAFAWRISTFYDPTKNSHFEFNFNFGRSKGHILHFKDWTRLFVIEFQYFAISCFTISKPYWFVIFCDLFNLYIHRRIFYILKLNIKYLINNFLITDYLVSAIFQYISYKLYILRIMYIIYRTNIDILFETV